jgi:hypothetical protein
MHTHPDVQWALVHDRQVRLRQEAERENRVYQLLVTSASGDTDVRQGAVRRLRRWFSRWLTRRSAVDAANTPPAGAQVAAD